MRSPLVVVPSNEIGFIAKSSGWPESQSANISFLEFLAQENPALLHF